MSKNGPGPLARVAVAAVCAGLPLAPAIAGCCSLKTIARVVIIPVIPPCVVMSCKGDVAEAARRVEQLGHDTLQTVADVGAGSLTSLARSTGEVVRIVKRSTGDTVVTVRSAAKNATATYTKGWRDAGEQAKRSFADTVDASNAAVRFTKRQMDSQLDATSRAARRVREGKVVDAMWGLSTELMRSSEKNFARATQESKLIDQAAASAAAVYGGPGGAAAYAAWASYSRYGDANLAFRAGLQAGVVSQVGSASAAMPSGTAGEVLRKAAVAGAAGGIAVAASGGDERAVRDAFLKSGGNVIIQSATDRAAAYAPDAASMVKTAQCVSARKVSCLEDSPVYRNIKNRILLDEHGNPRLALPTAASVGSPGNWTRIDPNSNIGKVRAVITSISKLPDDKSIPLMDNHWVLTWNLGESATVSGKSPSVVLTRVGTNPPFEFSASYRTGGAPATRSPTNRQAADVVICRIQNQQSSVRNRVTATGCKAMYTRHNGARQVIWESTQDPALCAPRMRDFIMHLQTLGMRCTVP